jgi:hypothetical protein
MSQEGHGIAPFDGQQGGRRQGAREEMQRKLESGANVRHREFFSLHHPRRLDLLSIQGLYLSDIQVSCLRRSAETLLIALYP